uniref:Disintegrin domain-containing protein n=1 Tax=Macrostomum lignano TaxID=282301 RepID=A0A1I8FB99_9PLAT
TGSETTKCHAPPTCSTLTFCGGGYFLSRRFEARWRHTATSSPAVNWRVYGQHRAAERMLLRPLRKSQAMAQMAGGEQERRCAKLGGLQELSYRCNREIYCDCTISECHRASSASVSSCGDYASAAFARSADGLCAVDNSDLDGKAVENCCVHPCVIFGVRLPGESRTPPICGGTPPGQPAAAGRAAAPAPAALVGARREALSSAAAPAKTGAHFRAPLLFSDGLTARPVAMDLLLAARHLYPLLLPIRVADCTNPEDAGGCGRGSAESRRLRLAALVGHPGPRCARSAACHCSLNCLGLDADKVRADGRHGPAQSGPGREEQRPGLQIRARGSDWPPAWPPRRLKAPAPSTRATSSETYAAVDRHSLHACSKIISNSLATSSKLGGVSPADELARDPAGRYGQKVSDFSWTLAGGAVCASVKLQPLLRQPG